MFCGDPNTEERIWLTLGAPQTLTDYKDKGTRELAGYFKGGFQACLLPYVSWGVTANISLIKAPHVVLMCSQE